ncbi:predicted protein [Uncinocarpus reesii 1704]|uniref:Uncharacterized protein n=1 Tax=Uncinocarpus reesii (strain UAMH 1704) TaxID=336963 RepID=C4JEG5_UNCRE|nr:uncharacterized protein UREG_00804 [Uncinocarpus reesii 1704]EEP75957.1 predicted protein [Uncinocarpus reesii 1704]
MGNILSTLADLAQDDRGRKSTRKHCSCDKCRPRSRSRRRQKSREKKKKQAPDSLLNGLLVSAADFLKAETEHVKVRTEQRKKNRREDRQPEPVVAAPPPAPGLSPVSQGVYVPPLATGALRDVHAMPRNDFAGGAGNGSRVMDGHGTQQTFYTARETQQQQQQQQPQQQHSMRRRRGGRRHEVPPDTDEDSSMFEGGWQANPRPPPNRVHQTQRPMPPREEGTARFFGPDQESARRDSV